MPKIYQNVEKFAAHKTAREAVYYYKVRPNLLLEKSMCPSNADVYAEETLRLLKKTEGRIVALTGASRLPYSLWMEIKRNIAEKVRKHCDESELRVSVYFYIVKEAHEIEVDLMIRWIPVEVLQEEAGSHIPDLVTA